VPCGQKNGRPQLANVRALLKRFRLGKRFERSLKFTRSDLSLRRCYQKPTPLDNGE